MNIKYTLLFAAAFMAVATLGAGVALPTPSFDQCGAPYISHLIMDGTSDAGDLSVYNDAESLTVQFISENGWLLSESNVHVTLNQKRIPLTASGAPRLTDFAHRRTYAPEVTGDAYTMPLGDWSVGTTVYISIHTELVQIGKNHRILKNAAAWAEGDLLGTGSAMAFSYTIQACE